MTEPKAGLKRGYYLPSPASCASGRFVEALRELAHSRRSSVFNVFQLDWLSAASAHRLRLPKSSPPADTPQSRP